MSRRPRVTSRAMVPLRSGPGKGSRVPSGIVPRMALERASFEPVGDRSRPTPGWRTRANALTALRLAIAPLLAIAIAREHPVVAVLLLTSAIATDFADGVVARRYGGPSPLGGLLDHAVDATLCVLGLAALARLGAVPWPLSPLVALAFAQYVVGSRSHRGRPLRGRRDAQRARHTGWERAGRPARLVARRRAGRLDARVDGGPPCSSPSHEQLSSE